MPFAHSDPRFTTWSKSPSSEMSLPSRTDATMPQPHEQKLHEVVNSLTFASFIFRVAALTVGRSRIASMASPATPPETNFNQRLRSTEVRRCAWPSFVEGMIVCLDARSVTPDFFSLHVR